MDPAESRSLEVVQDCRKLALASGAALKDVIAEANYAYLNRSR